MWRACTHILCGHAKQAAVWQEGNSARYRIFAGEIALFAYVRHSACFCNSTLCLNDASSIASNQSRLNYIYRVSINSLGTAAAAVLLTKPKWRGVMTVDTISPVRKRRLNDIHTYWSSSPSWTLPHLYTPLFTIFCLFTIKNVVSVTILSPRASLSAV